MSTSPEPNVKPQRHAPQKKKSKSQKDGRGRGRVKRDRSTERLKGDVPTTDESALVPTQLQLISGKKRQDVVDAVAGAVQSVMQDHQGGPGRGGVTTNHFTFNFTFN
jgi:hypothetical protein